MTPFRQTWCHSLHYQNRSYEEEELTEWNGVLAMSGVGRSILEVVVSVCCFVVNSGGYSVVGNRNTKVQEWYRGLAYLKSILKSRMIG